jgi:glycosyltransferase involved in cell wall biosynthesis
MIETADEIRKPNRIGERALMTWPVLLLARELDMGGSERQLTEIAKALDRSKFQPIAGCFQPAGVRALELADAGVPVVNFPVSSFASAGAISGASQFVRYIRANKIKIVHTFDYPFTVFGVPLAHFFTPAVVVSSQRSHRDLIPSNYRKLVRMTDRLADAVVVNCEYVKRHLVNDEHVRAQRIELCYNGVDLETFHPLDVPRPPELPADALVIGVVCVLRPEKGLSTLLNAFARVRQSYARIKLAIVGSGPMLDPLHAEARSLGVFEDCVFVPATQHVATWLQAIDIFVLPSLSEAFSNSIMEAMACGCCTVASNVGGNPELVRNGETGLTFGAGDSAGLSVALRTLIENEGLRKRLAAAGTRFMREHFSTRASAERMAEIYTKLIEQSGK